MDNVSQFANALCNLKITLQEVEQSGYRNADSIFGKIAHEIYGRNTLKVRLNLYVNLKQNRNEFKVLLFSKIDHQDNRSKTLVIGRTSMSDDHELPVTEIVSALSAENNDQILHQDEETRSGEVITPLNLNCTVLTKIMSANSKEHASEDHFTDCSQFENCSIISEPCQPSNFYENMDENFDVLGSDSQTPLRKATIISDSGPQIKQFSFKLTSQEWTSLKPINGSKGLSSNWCDIFASQIANFNPRCVFIFF